MESFDRKAHTYESAAFIQREAAAWLAEWLPANRHGTALEIAAGTGLFTRHLLPWNGPVLATDASPAMVAQGRRSVPAAQWQTATAENLPSVSANWIFTSSFLQWTDNPAAILRHWKTRLLPNGRILAGFFIAPTLPELAAVANHQALTWRTDAEWIHLFEEAGFAIVRAERKKQIHSFPSCLDLLRFLHRIGSTPQRRIPGTTLRTIARAYDAKFSTGESVPSTWTHFRLEARA